MARLGRPGLSEACRQEVWERWRDGESLSEIARAVGKQPGSIHGLLAARGGISPRVRRRSPRTLSEEEREEISRGIAADETVRGIVARIGRSPSTVSRELRRNGGRANYRAASADTRAWDRSRRPRPCRLESVPVLRRLVIEKLKLDLLPEQIAGWLKVEYPSDPSRHVSHETIYRTLYIRPRGVVEKSLTKRLRTRRTMRRSRNSTTAGQGRGRIIDAVPISERPREVETRMTPGHWEGDLIAGSGNSHIATLVERHSRLTILVKVAGKDTVSVVGALARKLRSLPAELKRSITWDRGMEMAGHASLTKKTGIPVYFCDPNSPWQRGSNENTNRLLRQYFPKGISLAGYSQKELNKYAGRLNRRPRKTLGFRSPADAVALIG